MFLFDKINPEHLDRRELQLTILACSTILILGAVITVTLPDEVSSTPFAISLLSDAAKAISRKLRGQDSLYVLRPHCFGIIVPTVSRSVAERISNRVAEGLSDAAGATNRFSCKLIL